MVHPESTAALSGIEVLAFDIFGTTVDWRTGVAEQIGRVFADRGVGLDAGEFADSWRDRYLPAMDRVNRGDRAWARLDVLHRESLDELLVDHAVGHRFDEADRRHMVKAWHRLPAWPDVGRTLERLRRRYLVVAFSNGGFALLASLVNAARLPFDAVVSAELARAYKPSHPSVYLTMTSLLDVEPAQALLVAAHRWDIDGARAAGLRTAFLERPHEKGPHRAADRAADVDSDLAVTSGFELADVLDA